MSRNVSVSVRMPPDLRDRLDAAADERVVSRSLLARKAIEHYLDNVPDAAEALRAVRQTATYEKPTWWEQIKDWWWGS